MKTISLDQETVDLQGLLAEMEQNPESIVFLREGKPIAHLFPSYSAEKDRLTPHPKMRRIQIHYDPTEPMDEIEWPEDLR